MSNDVISSPFGFRKAGDQIPATGEFKFLWHLLGSRPNQDHHCTDHHCGQSSPGLPIRTTTTPYSADSE
jgi:hypothetical protein